MPCLAPVQAIPPVTTVAIMQPYFYPYAGYFRLFSRADLFVVYDCVQFPRRGWVHRNRLTRPAGGLQWLTLRLEHAAQDTPIRAMQLAPGAHAQLAADLRGFPALGAAAAERLSRLPLFEGGAGLVDYLQRNLTAVLDVLGIGCPMVRSSTLGIDPALRGQQRILAIAGRLGAGRYLNAPGGRELYDPDAFARCGIELEFLEAFEGSPASVLERLCSEDIEAIRSDAR
jgi:hypothetical protein